MAASAIGLLLSTGCVSYSFGENNPIALTVEGNRTTIYFANCESVPNIAKLAFPGWERRLVTSMLTSKSSPASGSFVPLRIERVGTSTALTTDNEDIARLLERFPRDVDASPHLAVGHQRDGRIMASLDVSLSQVPVSPDPDHLEFVVRFADPDEVVDGPRTRISPVDESTDLC